MVTSVQEVVMNQILVCRQARETNAELVLMIGIRTVVVPKVILTNVQFLAMIHAMKEALDCQVKIFVIL